MPTADIVGALSTPWHLFSRLLGTESEMSPRGLNTQSPAVGTNSGKLWSLQEVELEELGHTQLLKVMSTPSSWFPGM